MEDGLQVLAVAVAPIGDEPGRYEVTLLGEAGAARRRSDSVSVIVEAQPPPGSGPEEDDGLDAVDDAGEGSVPWGVLVVALVLVAAFALSWGLSKLRRPPEAPR